MMTYCRLLKQRLKFSNTADGLLLTHSVCGCCSVIISALSVHDLRATCKLFLLSCFWLKMTSCLICLKQRGGKGLYHSVHGAFTALKQHALTFLVSWGLMHRRRDCAASAPPLLLLHFLKIQNVSQSNWGFTNPFGFTSLLFSNLLHLLPASPLLSPLSPQLPNFLHCNSHLEFPIHPLLPSTSLLLLLSRMRVLEPGRSADMSNVAKTDSYTETSAVSVEPAMTQAQEHTHTHTRYIVNRHRGRQTWRCRHWNPVMQVAIIITLYYVIIIKKLKMNPSEMRSDCER